MFAVVNLHKFWVSIQETYARRFDALVAIRGLTDPRVVLAQREVRGREDAIYNPPPTVRADFVQREQQSATQLQLAFRLKRCCVGSIPHLWFFSGK